MERLLGPQRLCGGLSSIMQGGPASSSPGLGCWCMMGDAAQALSEAQHDMLAVGVCKVCMAAGCIGSSVSTVAPQHQASP